MKMNKNLAKRILSLVLAVILAMGVMAVPGDVTLAAEGNGNYNRQTDPSTIDEWKHLFLEPETDGIALTTEHAGGVWTDKSVFQPSDIPNEFSKHLQVADTDDNFLVALSAIASNKEIVGYSTIPTDTVMVLDLSSSMRTSGNNRTSAIDDLVAATNKAITDLLELNKNNRVAVIMYAGNTNASFSSADGATVVVMPLDSYTPARTVAGVGQFLQATNNNQRAEICAGVKNSQGKTVTGGKTSATGTYLQDGIYEAMKVMLAAETTITSGVQAGAKRKPIMLLMTDGEGTLANNDYSGNDSYTDLGRSVMYNYDGYNSNYNHRDSIAFMTMLTAAFARKQIQAHYDNTPLVYTLAYGRQVTTMDEVKSVMNPVETSDAINRFWTPFLNGQSVEVYRSGNTRYYTQNASAQTKPNEVITEADKYYVDEYFPATNDAELSTAFGEIVDQIKIQSKYYPTYVQNDHNHDGYITFTDKIGGYMEVKDIKGFVIGDNYFSGAALAAGFTDENSIFGTIENPNAYGDNLVWSVKERLGISDTNMARQLIQKAYDSGQLSYASKTEFSNYIGWYSDSEGNYVDFWHEGMDVTKAPEKATHIVKSYGFLGRTDEVHGISDTDMLYASVRVSTEITDYDKDGITGETLLIWQLPATLIPTITYHVDVTIDSEGNITGVTKVSIENENVKPIRLLYEVGLRSDIHDWNLTEKVNDGYKESTANKEAGYVFYTNQWKKKTSDDDVSYRTDSTRNTYSHFEPSVENEHYYYTENTIIYTDENGTEYNGDRNTPPNAKGNYYRAYKVYEKLDNGTYRIHEHYEKISEEALSELTAANNFVNGQWVIRKGVIHRYFGSHYCEKNPNTTNTNNYVDYPSVVEESSTHNYHSYSTLGNNGKLTVTPATGIKVSKTLEEAVDGATNSFVFEIAGGTGEATIVRLDDSGNEASRTQIAFVNGEAEFTLGAGETVYIIGLQAGTTYTIREAEHTVYSLVSVTVNDKTATEKVAQITAVEKTIQSAEFVNGPKAYGNLYITKEITSDHDVPTGVLSEFFEIEVNVTNMDKVDVAGTYTVKKTSSNQELKAQVDERGQLKVDRENIKISEGETVEIIGLPEGTVLEIRERMSYIQDSYFADYTIKTRNHTGGEQDDDAYVTITRNENATAVITNTYVPVSTTLDLDVVGTKNFTVDMPLSEKQTFNFEVQIAVPQQDGSINWQTVTKKEASVQTQGSAADKKQFFSIENVLERAIFDKVGADAYRVLEVIPKKKTPGITYDRTLYTFTVVVSDNNGYLQAKIVDYQGNELQPDGNGKHTYEVEFNNSYHTAPISIDVQKNIDDKSNNPEITAAGFVIDMVEMNENWNGVKTGGVTLEEVTDGVGEARFARIYNQAGTYYYMISENATNKKTGWDYDETIYYVKVIVTEANDGDLTATVEISKDKGVTTGQEVVFKNTYQPKEAEVNVNTFVKKELTGRTLKAGEFTFQLTENGKTYENSASNRRLTGTNAADGTVAFGGTLKFSQIGIYEFDIREVKGQLGGVTYDNTVFDLVVEVSDENGVLSARTYFEDSVDNKVTFQNSYNAANATLVIDGTKKLTGRALINGEFDFTLTQVTDASGKAFVENGTLLHAENDPDNNADGITQFAFPAIEYTKADVGKTFYYLVAETHAGETIFGVTYDTKQYVIAVTVSDNLDGTLKVEKEILNETDQKLAFENVYTSQSAKVTLTAVKKLEGRDLEEKEFTFKLTQIDDTYNALMNGIHEEVKNNADGIVTFKELEFEKADDYYFMIEEVQGNAGGVTYDDTKYYAHIKVTDNGVGQLVAHTDITMEKVSEEEGQTTTVRVPASTILFNNVYKVDSTKAKLDAVKVLKGRTLKAGEFSFVLKGEAGEVLQTVTNAEDGKISFDEISYEKAGTYKYYVSEEAGTDKDVTYDKTEYVVEIKIVDDKAGKLIAEDPIIRKVGVNGTEKEIRFVNTYKEFKPSGPQTGDAAKTTLWSALFAVSGIGILATVFKRKKKEETE